MKNLFLFCSLFFFSYLSSSETTLILIRHGETNWNREDRLQGHTDVPLNEVGRLQAQSLAKKLPQYHSDIKAIYSSDLIRAYETASETAKKLGIEKITTSTLLRERYHGKAEGLTSKEALALYRAEIKRISETYPDRKENWDHSAVPDGETLNSLLRRVKEELTIIAESNPGKKVAIFTHGRVIRTVMSECLDSNKPVEIPNCAVATFIYSDEGPIPSLRFVKIEDMLSEK